MRLWPDRLGASRAKLMRWVFHAALASLGCEPPRVGHRWFHSQRPGHLPAATPGFGVGILIWIEVGIGADSAIIGVYVHIVVAIALFLHPHGHRSCESSFYVWPFRVACE